MPSSQRVYLLFCAILLTFLPVVNPDSAFAQTKPVVGLRQNTPEVHALIHARIVPAPGRSIENGTIIVRDGVITKVGADVAIPADARTWDYAGMTVYPGLIDGYSQLGIEKKKEKKREPPSEKV
ncbi:MAG: hypothetical protein ACE5IY_20170 [bacterium]